MNNVEMNEKKCMHNYTHICWSSVISGSLVAIGLVFLFCLLTEGLGLTSATRTEGSTEILVFAVLAWLFVGSYVVFFMSGYVTGKIARTHCERSCHGLLYGFMSWALAIIVCIMLVTPMTQSKNILMIKTTTQSEVIATPNEQQSNNNEIMTPATQHEVHKVGLATLAAFLIFFAGALGSSLGGYYAIQYHRKEDEQVRKM